MNLLASMVQRSVALTALDLSGTINGKTASVIECNHRQQDKMNGCVLAECVMDGELARSLAAALTAGNSISSLTIASKETFMHLMTSLA